MWALGLFPRLDGEGRSRQLTFVMWVGREKGEGRGGNGTKASRNCMNQYEVKAVGICGKYDKIVPKCIW